MEDQQLIEENQSNDEIDQENKENFFELEENLPKTFDEKSHLKCSICDQICVQPKFLSCFHSFCFQCIDKFLQEDQSNSNSNSNDLLHFQCPSCQQITQISNKNDLIDDFVLISEIEEYEIANGTIECRACTSNDRAVAHCSTCLAYLCLKCCQAHQYMKCFEQHRVRDLSQTNHFKVNDRNGNCTSKEDLKEKLQILDEQRSNALAHLDHQLTSLQNHFDQTKQQIDSAYEQYQLVLKDIYMEYLSLLNSSQREEEMRLIDKLEEVQKGSQSFDDIRSVSQRYLNKSNEKEFLIFKEKLFDEKSLSLQHLFQISSNQSNFNSSIQFQSHSIQHFKDILKSNFGQLNKSSDDKRNSSPILPHDQRGLDFSSEIRPNGDSVSSSSGVGSLAIGLMSSSHGTILSNGNLSPSNGQREQEQEQEQEREREEYFLHSSSSSNPIEPVVENLRALESIFADQLSNVVQHNVQRNLQEILHLNQQNDHQYSILTRQTSAPPLGHRSPSSTMNPYAPPSLLTTYSSTNSGGSSNGNNSRSTTPFSSGTLNCPIDLNYSPNSSLSRRTGQSMQVRAKFGSLGPQKCQFNAPHGFCLGIEEEIIVADTNNHRIQIFDKLGEYKYQFGIPGKEEGQLWYPRKVAVIRQSGKFVVCDRGNERSRMQIFNRNGHFIKKISIRYIDIVAGLAITQQGNIVAVDSVSPTVFCISECGDLLKWFDCSDYMREPSDIAIFNNEYFVCDFKGHCVVVFDEDGIFLRRIGSESITNFPNGIDISDAGDVIIGDSHGNRFHIAVYSRQGDFLQEFDCPFVKVSRCCGLKITSDGFIVTLAKNNHHVLVLNTVYLS